MTYILLSFLVSFISCSFLSSFGETKGIFCFCFQWCTCCSRKCMCVPCYLEKFYKFRMFFSLTRTFFMKHFSQNILVDNKLKTIKCLWSLKHQIRIFPQHFQSTKERLVVTSKRWMGVMLCDKCLGQLLELESTKWKNDTTGYTIHKLCMHYIPLMLKVLHTV